MSGTELPTQEIGDEMVGAYQRAANEVWEAHTPDSLSVADVPKKAIRAGLAAALAVSDYRCVTVVEEGPPEFFIDDHDMAVIGLYEEVESLELVESSEGQERSEEKEHG